MIDQATKKELCKRIRSDLTWRIDYMPSMKKTARKLDALNPVFTGYTFERFVLCMVRDNNRFPSLFRSILGREYWKSDYMPAMKRSERMLGSRNSRYGDYTNTTFAHCMIVENGTFTNIFTKVFGRHPTFKESAEFEKNLLDSYKVKP